MMTRLMAPQFVKPYVKSNKNDSVDAEAICEAVQRPSMRFVPSKSEGQQDLQALHMNQGGKVLPKDCAGRCPFTSLPQGFRRVWGLSPCGKLVKRHINS
jgi:hypothetical protein